MMGDFIEGDDSAEKFLGTGSPLKISIAHYHSMGKCTGSLAVQRGKLAFISDKGDGFEIPPGGLAGAEVRKISKGMMANEKLPDWPVQHAAGARVYPQWQD